MKTTIDIPDSELEKLIAHTKARTKKEAILTAIRDYNARRARRELTRVLGTFEQIISRKELEQMRSSG